jgi:hypothetical protein
MELGITSSRVVGTQVLEVIDVRLHREALTPSIFLVFFSPFPEL